MKKLYILIGVCGLLVWAYFSGTSLGRAKCMEHIAAQSAKNSVIQTKKKEKINAEIYSIGVNDIRNILRTKYTIAD